MATLPLRKTKPRRTLDSLFNEWQTADKNRRKIIEKHWPRSVRAMLASLLAEHPEKPLRPTPMEAVAAKFANELMIWWDEPFGPDGIPRVISWKPGSTTRMPDEELFIWLVNMGFADSSQGFILQRNPTLRHACRNQITMIAWDTAWQERHRSGAGDGRPEIPCCAGLCLPNTHWDQKDYQHLMSWELRSLQYRQRNAEWFKKHDKVYSPVPLGRVFNLPLMSKLITGEEAVPTPAPGQAPIPLPKGPNGRRMIRQIFMDENDDLGCILREQTEEEAAEEVRQTTWRVCSWYDPPGKVSPREFMRPYLEGTENEHLLEGYSDHLVQYDPP